MTKDQEDILNMYQTTFDILQNHNAVWSGNVPFSDAVDDLSDGIDDVEEQRDIQETDNTGITEDKDNKRKSLEDQTFAVGQILVFYASAIKNRKLLKKVNYTRSELTRTRDNELPGKAKAVHEEAVAHAAGALPYGLTATMTTDLGTIKGEYEDYVNKPRDAKTETSTATEALPGIYTDIDELLEERIDSGMELYRVSNPDFYGQYFNARIIVNSPTQKRALEVHFEDENGTSIEHVKVLINGSINRRSSSKGNIRVQNLSEGAHSLTASLPGFQNHTENFNVITGETTKIVVKMVKG